MTAASAPRWLIPLGYLVLKSGYFPRIVGALLLIAAASWLLQFFLYFFAPGFSVNTGVFQAGAVGELVFIAWLLIFSARPSASAASAALRTDTLHHSPKAFGASPEDL